MNKLACKNRNKQSKTEWLIFAEYQNRFKWHIEYLGILTPANYFFTRSRGHTETLFTKKWVSYQKLILNEKDNITPARFWTKREYHTRKLSWTKGSIKSRNSSQKHKESLKAKYQEKKNPPADYRHRHYRHSLMTRHFW